MNHNEKATINILERFKGMQNKCLIYLTGTSLSCLGEKTKETTIDKQIANKGKEIIGCRR